MAEETLTKAKQSGDYSHLAFFGFVADPKTNEPLVQKAGDALPGKAYITSTWTTVPGTPDGTQRHFIDARELPYVVLPKSFAGPMNVPNAALAVVYRLGKEKEGSYISV